jgi:hypothetical protein
MRVRSESRSRNNTVLVDDAEMTEAHLLRVMVISEGKRMAAIEPGEFRLSSFIAAAHRDHPNLPR